MRRLINRLAHRLRSRANVLSERVDQKSAIGAGSTVREGAVVSNCTIGRACYINHGASLRETDLGDFTSIGPGALIGQNEHLVDEVSTCNGLYTGALAEKLAAKNRPRTRIGADVWVGGNAVILRGVEVGIGAIVGAGAVVTKPVPPYAIALGVPARVVDKRFGDVAIEALLASAWWNNPADRIRAALAASAAQAEADEKVATFLRHLAVDLDEKTGT
jgi:acetyltransferase-like isoleucine patch superfamily enzyme